MKHAEISTGCAKRIATGMLTLVFGVAFVLSLFVFGPQLETYLELQVCQPDSIVKTSNGRGKAKTITCVDKKTGKKTDVSVYQYFFCCPPAIILGFVAIYGVFINLFFRKE